MISENFERTLERIIKTSISAGRKPEEVKLLVVTKGHSINKIKLVIAAGALRLGENYVEEAINKINQFPTNSGIEWHMIGHIQSRKASQVCEYFSYIHAVDSVKLANRLNNCAIDMNRIIPVLLECNVSGEESKFGFNASLKNSWVGLNPLVEKILSMSNIKVCGLMTMAPYFLDVQSTRPYFALLRQLRDYFTKRFPSFEWSELSMGMSADYEIAIQEGSTILRIGTAIMGER